MPGVAGLLAAQGASVDGRIDALRADIRALDDRLRQVGMKRRAAASSQPSIHHHVQQRRTRMRKSFIEGRRDVVRLDDAP